MRGEEKFFKALGQRIRTLRKKHEYSQEDMIDFGFSARHWQQIESGRPITVRTLLRIAQTFQIPVTDLFPFSHSHRAASYGDGRALVDDFSRFIEAALNNGYAVIVIVTESHRRSLLQTLRTRGLDIAASIRAGQFIALDVSDTLSKFMVNDFPDKARFLRVAGKLIGSAARAAKGRHPRVAACGECAPVLLAQGKLAAAIQLERLWDEVAGSHDIDILCGYVFGSHQSKKDRQIFQRICLEHSNHIVPAEGEAISYRRLS
jgi:transcriptional regulator with XRE-family HTH domain